ncbi:MAG: N-acetyltransferase family protein [Actinomycetota bacterium]
MELQCFECGQTVTASALSELGDAFVAHARSRHDWPYPDQSIRNYAEATQRLTGASERLADIPDPVIRPVTPDRTEDWLDFFDHDAFAGNPAWADCYCLEPHVRPTGEQEEESEPTPWQKTRAAMASRLCGGEAFGYLAYVDDKPAAWVNASKRSDYSPYYRPADDRAPAEKVIGVSCFVIAPPYRRHGIADRLLDRVIQDAPDRGASWVEAYPYNDPEDSDAANYRGPRSMYEKRGFESIEVRDRDTVVRLRVGDPIS